MIEYVTFTTNNLVTKTAQKVVKSVLNTLSTEVELTDYAKKIAVSALLQKKANVLIT